MSSWGTESCGKYYMIYPLQNHLYKSSKCSTNFNFLLLVPFCSIATRTIAGFLTKLWPNLLAICDFQPREDDFFKLWTFRCPYAYKYCVLFFSFLPCPRPQMWFFQSDIDWNYQGSENHGRLANQPFGKHVLGSFSADFWRLPPNPHSEGFSINLKITALGTQCMSLRFWAKIILTSTTFTV